MKLAIIIVLIFITESCTPHLLSKEARQLIPKDANKVIMQFDMSTDSLYLFVSEFLVNEYFRIYNSDREIVSKERIREKPKTKLFYFYDKYGIIKTIEEYESFNIVDYKLIYTTVFKVNRKAKHIDKSVVIELNSVLIEND